MNDNGIAIKGFRRITDTEHGCEFELPNTWPGVLGRLLRKITKDKYDGRGRDGVFQWQEEALTYTQFEEQIEELVRAMHGENVSDATLKSEKSRLLTEFQRPEGVSIKVLGEFLMVLDPEWVDITVTIGRKSGTIKPFTVHIGGLGTTTYPEPTRDEEYFQMTGIHEEQLPMPESIVTKKMNKEKKPRKKRGSSTNIQKETK